MIVDSEMRKRIARIISPKTSFEDFEGILLSRFDMDRRRVAYEKADAVIAIFSAELQNSFDLGFKAAGGSIHPMEKVK